MYKETYFIIYPSGDRTKLSVTSLNQYMLYEKSDYAVASRLEFDNSDEAVAYAKELAKEHALQYIGDEDNYLD